MLCIKKFEETYKKDPVSVAFCPYRVCPMGAHSDHQYGKITGFAIDKGIHIAYAPKQNGVIELSSLQFEKRAQWHIRAVPDHHGFFRLAHRQPVCPACRFHHGSVPGPGYRDLHFPGSVRSARFLSPGRLHHRAHQLQA